MSPAYEDDTIMAAGTSYTGLLRVVAATYGRSMDSGSFLPSIGGLSVVIDQRGVGPTYVGRVGRGFLGLAAAAAAPAAAVGALAAGPYLLDIGGLPAHSWWGFSSPVFHGLFSACLLILCYAPEYFGSTAGSSPSATSERPGLLRLLGMALRRGIRRRYLIVTGGYVLLAL